MKNNNTLRNIIIGGVLCTMLIAPSITQGANKKLPENTTSIPFTNKVNHWAEKYLNQLSVNHNVKSVFADKNMDDVIKVEDFQDIVKLVIDDGYSNFPDTISREALVYELTKLWAEKTERDLDNIPVIKMLVFADTDKIESTYKHSIAVAYMKDIAKGKSERVFAPKDKVTYGELAALISNTKEAIENEVKTREPIKKDVLETKGSYEIKDDKIVFDFELINNGTQTKKLMFGSGQQFEIIVTDEEGKEVYKYSDNRYFTMAIEYLNLEPGKSIKWQDVWDMKNKQDEKITPGKYIAQISISALAADNHETISQDHLITQIQLNIENSDGYENELTKEGIIKPESAKKIIKDTADKTIYSLSIKDMVSLSDYIHPDKGVRFTPYTNVSLKEDVVFNKDEIRQFFKDEDAYKWGYYDGKGNEIKLTPSKYYEEFIYSEDFINAPQIAYNEVLSSGNMLENQFEVYDNSIVVEYYFPGFNPDFAGMDWKSLRLVFEKYEGNWKLIGIIHNQWTI